MMNFFKSLNITILTICFPVLYFLGYIPWYLGFGYYLVFALLFLSIGLVFSMAAKGDQVNYKAVADSFYEASKKK